MQELLRWLCVTLLDALFPGASFSKCLMSLHLLCLLGQLFTFSSGTPTNTLNVLFRDNSGVVIVPGECTMKRRRSRLSGGGGSSLMHAD